MQDVGAVQGTSKSFTFIVEHLDPELEDWQALEYNTIAKECESFLLSGLDPSFDSAKLTIPSTSKTHKTTEALYPTVAAKQRVCLLDPKAEKDIAPEDADLFDSFLFGGILGDDPPRDRTGDLRKLGFPGRRLGPEQMTTDTAVRVTRTVVQEKMKLSDIAFVDRPEFSLSPGETITMPFKYVKGVNGPILPEGMLELLASDADKDILDLL